MRLPRDAANTTLAAWHTEERKQGFRLHTSTGEPASLLEFEAAFDWKHSRNNHPLRVAAPLRAFRPDALQEVLIRFTGPKLELSIDGVLMDEEWPVGRVAPPTAVPLLLTTGALQKVMLWNRALSDDEIALHSGGAQKIAGREREILGPLRPLTQYWKPRGWNASVGDCMPFFNEGRFHLYYLFDRRGHASKWGLGAHQWAHASTLDLVEWTHHPMAVPISRQDEGSICTGSVFFSSDEYHAFYAVRTADGSPARLTSARSKDGIHFEKSDWSMALREPYSGPPARDPVVFRDPGNQAIPNASGGDGGDIGAFEFGSAAPSLKILSFTRIGNGDVVLQVAGVPNGVHRIQASLDLRFGSFIDIATVTADAAGRFQYQEPVAGLTNFYRVVFP